MSTIADIPIYSDNDRTLICSSFSFRVGEDFVTAILESFKEATVTR